MKTGIITYPLAGVRYDADDAQTYHATRSSGVFAASGNYEVTADGTSRNITVGKGLAWIAEAEFKGKSVTNTSPITLTVPDADPALPRIDRVVIRFDAGENKSVVDIVKGTPSSDPTPPDITRTEAKYELGIATINVPAQSVDTMNVVQSDITSTIEDPQVCGIMADSVSNGNVTVGGKEGLLCETGKGGVLVAKRRIMYGVNPTPPAGDYEEGSIYLVYEE